MGVSECLIAQVIAPCSRFENKARDLNILLQPGTEVWILDFFYKQRKNMFVTKLDLVLIFKVIYLITNKICA